MRTHRPLSLAVPSLAIPFLAVPFLAVVAAAIAISLAVVPSTALAQPLPPQQPGYIGLVVESRGTGAGLKIVQLTAGGPAEQGGLKVGDRLMMIDTIAINSPTDLARGLSGKFAGSTLKIRFERGGVEGQANVRLSARPRNFGGQAIRPGAPGLLPGQAIPTLPADATDDGILLGVQTVIPQLRDLLRIKAPGQFTRGALVKQVYPGTPAARAGVRVDGLIFAVDSRDVTSPTELIRRIRRAGPGSEVVLSVFTAGRQEKIKVQLAGARAANKLPAASILPPQASTPPQNPSSSAMDARMGALERRMTMIEQRLLDLQRTLDAIRLQR